MADILNELQYLPSVIHLAGALIALFFWIFWRGIARLHGAVFALERALHMTITFVIDEYPPDLRRAFIYKFKRASKAMLEHDMDTVGVYYTPTRRKGYRMVHEGVLQRLEEIEERA